MINENNCYNYILLLKDLLIDKEDKQTLDKFIKNRRRNLYQSNKDINHIVWSKYCGGDYIKESRLEC